MMRLQHLQLNQNFGDIERIYEMSSLQFLNLSIRFQNRYLKHSIISRLRNDIL